MFGEQRLSIDDVKRILQLYESLQRLEVLNQKIKNDNTENVKKKIMTLKSIGDEKKKSVELEQCLLEMIDKYDENKKNICLYHTTVNSVITAFEKIFFSDRAEGNCEDIYIRQLDGGNNGSIQ